MIIVTSYSLLPIASFSEQVAFFHPISTKGMRTRAFVENNYKLSKLKTSA